MNSRRTLTTGLSALAFALVMGGAHAQTYNYLVPLHGKVAGEPPAEPTFGPISLSTDVLDFGTVNVGDTQTRSLQVSNAGAVPARVLGITTDNPLFQATHNCPSELPAGQSCVVQVQAQPMSEGSFSGLLQVTDSLTTRTANLLLQAGSPSLVVSGDGAFPVTHLGDAVNRSFTATNAGSGTLVLSTVGIAGDDDFTVTGGSCQVGTVLGASQDCSIIVTASPEAAGVRSGQLTVEAGSLVASQSLTVSVPDPATYAVSEVQSDKTTLVVNGIDSAALSAVVRDAAGLPAGPGVEVTWESVDTPTTYGAFATATSLTDANGVAYNTWTSGSAGFGAQARIHARVGGPSAPLSPALYIDLEADMSYVVTAIGSNTSNLNAGGTLVLHFTVRDADGNNPGAGIPVQVSTSGGSLAAHTIETNGSGVSATQLTAPTTAGPVTVSAWVFEGQPKTTRTFEVKPHSGSAEVRSFSVSHNTAWANNVNPVELTAIVQDQFGNPVPDQAVEFTATDGTLSQASVTTDASGVAKTLYTPARILARGSTGGLTRTAIVTAKAGSQTVASSAPITLKHFFVLSDFRADDNCIGMVGRQSDAVKAGRPDNNGTYYYIDVPYTRLLANGNSQARTTSWSGDDSCIAPGSGVQMAGGPTDFEGTLPTGQKLYFLTNGTGGLAISPVW